MNLIESTFEEIKRCRELLEEYKKIGPSGIFGAIMIADAISRAEKAIAEDNVVDLLYAYQELKDSN